MKVRVAINGYGRIGRCVLRALYEGGRTSELSVVAINELVDIKTMAHLTRFDSTHGRFNGTVSVDGDTLVVNNDPIRVVSEPDMAKLPWAGLGVDVVLECTGSFTRKDMAARHLEAGARKVVFSCPAERDVDATIVYGLNQSMLSCDHTIISNASCTSNCISHLIRILDQAFGIEQGVITTIHSAMNDQPVIDSFCSQDYRKNRGAFASIVPVGTGLEKGIDRLFPHLKGRFEAVALRVPTPNVSAMQLTVNVGVTTDRTAVNQALRSASQGALEGILGFSDEPLVSCDFNHDPRSAIVDAAQTRVVNGSLVHVMAWFDNEWGYANRMLDTCLALVNAR
ncbi:MAG: glyceraldehyde 3-phosphate dehydrogenase NAD-binding domain-containing protein [Pseudomonadota bacterium]